MAILKAGSTAGGSPILTEATLGDTVYNKTETENLIDTEIAALSDTYYTETEVDNLISEVGGFNNIPVNVIGETGTDQNLDITTYSVFEVEPTADITLNFTNVPSGKRSISLINLINGGNYNISFSPNVIWEESPIFSVTPTGDGYSIEDASYVGNSYTTSSQVSDLWSGDVNPDGTSFYIYSRSGTSTIS